MPRFEDCVAKGAMVLGLAPDALLGTLKQAGISESDWPHLTPDDFINELRKVATTRDAATFKLRAAFTAIDQASKGAPPLPAGMTPASATADQLVQLVDLRDPEGEVMQALLRKPVSPKKPDLTLAEVSFLVLDDDGGLDRASTRRVLELLQKGALADPDEILDPDTAKTHVVFRHTELPTTQTLIDPLFPEEDLHLDVSQRFKTIVRLVEEKHQLLIFLRRKGKVPEPMDRPKSEEIVATFREKTVDQLLRAYGGKGAYEKAKRLPVGAPAGLPTMTRPSTSTRGSHAADSHAAAGTSEKLSDFAASLAEDSTVNELRSLLSSRGIATNGSKLELAGRFSEAFRKKRVSVEAVLSGSQADYLRDICSEFGLPTGRKQDNLDAILRKLGTLEQDGALYRRDEIS